ncbi:MAG: sensor histidine kinase [Leptolyngbya sp. PLA1]|nr:sensor histidine kinase [Leptolyngbya sp. PLA1]
MSDLPDARALRIRTSQNRWLVRLRWVACALILGGGALHWWKGGAAAPFALGAVMLAWNSGLWLWMRYAKGRGGGARTGATLATVQVFVDLVFLALLAAWTGGASSPFLFAYFFHMTVAAILQPRAWAYGACVWGVLVTAGACAMSGSLPSGTVAWGGACAWAAALVATVVVSEHLVRGLRRREQAAGRRLAHVRALGREVERHRSSMVQAEKLAAMGRLATGVAHEITNPLASMDALVQLMQRRTGPSREEDLTALRGQIQRILGIVRQLTAFAHPGRGRMEHVSLNEVVRASVDMVMLSARGKGDRVRLELSEGVGTVRTNPEALGQVLTNLLVNALDATEGASDPSVVVATSRRGDGCVIEVRDNGHGIPPDDLARVFEPFFTTKPVGKGTGLGLSISARLAEEMGATLEAASKAGEGASFCVRLPPDHRPSEAPGSTPGLDGALTVKRRGL